MKAYLGRRYRFSAAHRLHTERYTAEQNREVYGKCNNPHGHGHNYVVEVTFGGQVDPVTGVVCNLAALDSFARERLLDLFELQNLNMLECFREQVPSTENLAMVVHGIFEEFEGSTLEKVRVEETDNNSFEYGKEEEQVLRFAKDHDVRRMTR